MSKIEKLKSFIQNLSDEDFLKNSHIISALMNEISCETPNQNNRVIHLDSQESLVVYEDKIWLHKFQYENGSVLDLNGKKVWFPSDVCDTDKPFEAIPDPYLSKFGFKFLESCCIVTEELSPISNLDKASSYYMFSLERVTKFNKYIYFKEGSDLMDKVKVGLSLSVIHKYKNTKTDQWVLPIHDILLYPRHDNAIECQESDANHKIEIYLNMVPFRDKLEPRHQHGIDLKFLTKDDIPTDVRYFKIPNGQAYVEQKLEEHKNIFSKRKHYV